MNERRHLQQPLLCASLLGVTFFLIFRLLKHWEHEPEHQKKWRVISRLVRPPISNENRTRTRRRRRRRHTGFHVFSVAFQCSSDSAT